MSFRSSVALLGALFAPSVAVAGDLRARLESADAVEWVGVDYTNATFMVPETFADPDEKVYFAPIGGVDEQVQRFARPDDAWKQLSVDWNTMADNLLRHRFEELLQRDVKADLPTPAGQTHKSAPYFQSQYDYKTHTDVLTQEDVQAQIKKYKLTGHKGVGIVFVVERVSTIEKQECLWPTFFDLSDKKILQTERVCEKPGGSSFRDFWLKPVVTSGKDAIDVLKKQNAS